MHRLNTIEQRVNDNEQRATSDDDHNAGGGLVVDEEHQLPSDLRLEDEREIQGPSALAHKNRDLTYVGSIYQMLVEATEYTLKALESSAPTWPSDSNPSEIASATLNNAFLNIQNFKLSLEDSKQLHSVLDVPAALAKRWVTSQYLPIRQAASSPILLEVRD